MKSLINILLMPLLRLNQQWCVQIITYIDIFNVFARRTKNDLELDELNFLKDVEIDKFSEASNKNNYSNIYDYETDIVNNWKYNGF